MSDTPFWERDDNDDGHRDTPAPEPPAADDTPDSITIDGHTFVRTPGVAAHVTWTDDDGRDMGTAYIPYDPDQQPSEEEVFAQAEEARAGLKHMRSVLNDDAVLNLARDIETSGTARAMVNVVAHGVRDGLRITVTADDSETPEELAELETVAREAERLVHDNIEVFLDEIAKQGQEPGKFWQDFARDILAHSLLWARTATEETLGDYLDRIDDEEFDRVALETYRNGPYVTQAMLTLQETWIGLLAEIWAAAFEAEGDTPGMPAVLETLMESARKSLAKKGATPETNAQAVASAFTAEGYGRVTNDIVSAGSRRMLVAPWSGPRKQHPEFSFTSDAGHAIYALSEKAFPLAADAWNIIECLDDAHADTLDYILAKSLANKASHQRDAYGSFTVTADEILDARGIHKHKSGGHKPNNVAEVVSHIDHLAQLMVRASVTGYAKAGNGKRGKKESLTIEAPLILIPQTLYRTSLDGRKTPIAWHLRPGDWAIEMERFTPQLATMMQGILKLHARRDAHAKRIGRYLGSQYRIRANQKTWAQPYRIETLLDGAGVEVDRGHPDRFRQRIEAALNLLTNPVDMHGPVCVASWKYPHPIDATGRGWFARWLASGVVILPPDAVKDPYQPIGERKRRPRKLASGRA